MQPIGELLPDYKGQGLLEDSALEAFLSAYPRKAGKPSTKENAWNKLNERDRLAAFNGIKYHLENNPQWRDKTMIPHPATYLNGRRWEDEIAIPRKEEIAADLSDISKMVWSACTQMFGESWLRKHGDRPSPIWVAQLRNKTVLDIQRALRALVAQGEQNPPSLPYFISLAKGTDLEEFKQLPRPQGNPEIAERAFEQMRQILGSA